MDANRVLSSERRVVLTVDENRVLGETAGPEARGQVTPVGPAHPFIRFNPLRRLSPRARQRLLRVLAFLFVVVISALIVLYSDRLLQLGAYGYGGLFVLNLLSSATLILPAPGIALAFAAGASLNPFLVGAAIGSGSALGELTGYLAGYSGRGFVENDPQYDRVRGWMAHHGLWVIFILSIVPNPLFDVAGMTAGAMRMPVWKFLAAALPGKIIKAVVLALAGAGMMDALSPTIERLLAR